jgi:hypothetical protein
MATCDDVDQRDGCCVIRSTVSANSAFDLSANTQGYAIGLELRVGTVSAYFQ